MRYNVQTLIVLADMLRHLMLEVQPATGQLTACGATHTQAMDANGGVPKPQTPGDVVVLVSWCPFVTTKG